MPDILDLNEMTRTRRNPIGGLSRMVSSFFKSLWNFLRLLCRMPTGRSGVSKAGAKRVRQASHVSTYGFTGTSKTDKFLAKELRDGHK